MGQPLGGFGQSLPLPQNLFPSELANSAQDFATNVITLAPGDVMLIPAGTWFIKGRNAIVQFLDPVTQIWRSVFSSLNQPQYVKSDGATARFANLTGCPVCAVVQNGGTGFTSATATVTASAGGSTWLPIVGGALSVVSITNAGKNYTMPPIVAIPGPPQPGVPASAYATISGGSVTAVSLVNFGAGYVSALAKAVLLPNPADPNAGSISTATVSLAVDPAKASAITAVLCTNNGASVSSVALTAAGGAGSGATITPYILQTMTGATVTAAGAGYTGSNVLNTIDGTATVTSSNPNPTVELTDFIPRVGSGQLGNTAGAPNNTLTTYDPGMFLEPSGTTSIAALLFSTVTPTTVATVFALTGGLPETVIMQPAP